MRDNYTANSHYLTYTFLFKWRMYCLNLGVKRLISVSPIISTRNQYVACYKVNAGLHRVVQYWRLVSTRKAHLSIRTSRTGRLMYSRVVVDPWIHSVKCEFWHLHIPHIVVLVERGIFILPCAFHALLLVERGILILSCAFRESVMIFTDRQRLVNTLDDPYDSYEWTSQLYESIQVVSIGHSWSSHWFHSFLCKTAPLESPQAQFFVQIIFSFGEKEFFSWWVLKIH